MTNEEVVKQLQAEEPLEKRFDDYDFKECMKYAPFKVEEIETLIACYPGAADEDSWHYIAKLKDGKFGWVTASCDYTGWGCQEGGEGKICTSIEDAIDAAVVSEYDTQKQNVKESLLGQINDGKPYGLRK